MTISFHPVTPDRWPDLDRLFSNSGATPDGEPAQCWCMEWRRPRDVWEAGRGEGNRQAMRQLVESGGVPGILAYDGAEPVAWCSISPRVQHGGLQAMGAYRNFANPDVWLVSCFYITDAARGQGMMARLLDAGIAYAKDHGAKIVEGYPGDDKTEGPGPGLYLGSAGTFTRAGFVEVARAVYNRPVMRYLEPRA